MSQLDHRELRQLDAAIKGVLVTAESESYDETRAVFNGTIDRRPLAIAVCASVDDLRPCLEFSRATGRPLSIRGGGHNIAGSALVDDGLVVDFSQLRAVTVDPAGMIARAQPGARLLDFEAATQRWGLTTPTGIISDTGLAGLTLGGGLGWLMAKYGLTCDNLLAADAVLPDGQQVRAGEQVGEDPDLLWALRGGGGNFAVVTSFEYRLHQLRHVTAGSIEYSLDDAVAALSELDKVARDISDDLVLSPTLITNKAGAKVYHLDLCHAGEEAVAAAELAELRAIGQPLHDNIERRAFIDWQQYLDDAARKGRRSYWKSMNIPALTDDFLAFVVEQFRGVPSPYTMLTFDHIHGAVTRVPRDATAFGNRSVGYEFLFNTNWDDERDDSVNIEWTRGMFDAVSSIAGSDSVYVNYLGDEGDERVRQAYAGSDLTRLRALKSRYDPNNLLRTNQNIRPL